MATFPTIAAGQRITSSMLSALTWNYVIKAGTQTVTNSIAPVSDADLFFPIVAGATYDFELYLRFSALAAAGIRLSWSAPSGTAFNRLCMGPGTANATQTDANTTEMRWAIHGNTTQCGYTDPRNSVSLHTQVLEQCVFTAGGTSGNLQLQWAQFVANATGSVVQASSFIRYRQIG